ncbi:hypothetical protein ODZ84_22700 [Chryseobacterium fluminis]|uniref:hypothetical protein n=1 Tax=Chryseobacterium fluminis TaxID=2983606 RepID=UPI00225BF120|nr:hypothetical protein [Chryseobacterium sp. MMS21-Ot14]UZT97942.1 hypothetical protein ODZ84_22700 [Chryseobacterium sp. MMS21-Ot14]
MAEYYNIQLTTEDMAPIERAHLHRGFSSKKTPLKWIRFFRMCVLQRELSLKKRKKKTNTLWISYFIIAVVMIFLVPGYWIAVNIILFVVVLVMDSKNRREFKKNYTDGYDFFSDYFSALFTLIEEELPQLGTIQFTANVKETLAGVEHLKSAEDAIFETPGFISGKEEFYEKEIGKGYCTLKDGAEISFSFVEKVRRRIIKKKGLSGKRKTKEKYKSVYPFILKLKLPKSIYQLKTNVDKADIQIKEDESFYYMKARRKFDVKDENPDDYSAYQYKSTPLFSVEYFSLEVVNLFNICYGCFTLK